MSYNCKCISSLSNGLCAHGKFKFYITEQGRLGIFLLWPSPWESSCHGPGHQIYRYRYILKGKMLYPGPRGDPYDFTHPAVFGCHKSQDTIHKLSIIGPSISEAENGGVVRSVNKGQLKTMPKFLLYTATSTSSSNSIQHLKELSFIWGYCDWSISCRSKMGLSHTDDIEFKIPT